MKHIIFFANGNTAAFGDSGLQAPELQVSWFELYLGFLETRGIDPTECKFTINGGGGAIVVPFKTDQGTWNWEIERRS